MRFVADHAKRAVSTFPRCSSRYYGVDYAARAEHGVAANEVPRQFRPDGSYPPDDLSWYANIPVPTSYMCLGSEADFFGGYDHRAQAGIVHVADHHIAPGKKQWCWGNHEFGYAWDRLLTEPDALGVHRPYIELMAGVYRQSAGLLLSDSRRDAHLHAVLVPDPRHRPRAPGQRRRGGQPVRAQRGRPGDSRHGTRRRCGDRAAARRAHRARTRQRGGRRAGLSKRWHPSCR